MSLDSIFGSRSEIALFERSSIHGGAATMVAAEYEMLDSRAVDFRFLPAVPVYNLLTV